MVSPTHIGIFWNLWNRHRFVYVTGCKEDLMNLKRIFASKDSKNRFELISLRPIPKGFVPDLKEAFSSPESTNFIQHNCLFIGGIEYGGYGNTVVTSDYFPKSNVERILGRNALHGFGYWAEKNALSFLIKSFGAKKTCSRTFSLPCRIEQLSRVGLEYNRPTDARVWLNALEKGFRKSLGKKRG